MLSGRSAPDAAPRAGRKPMTTERLVYMDHAATTPVAPEVAEAMRPFLSERYGNPSGIYALAQDARRALDEARERCAALIGARPGEIIFTSGGTESDNAGVMGPAIALAKQGRRVVATAIEHHAVLNAAALLESLGWEAARVKPQRNGVVRAEDVSGAVTPDTTVVSMMLANNETGVLQPVAEMARLVKERAREERRTVAVHTDAVQAAGAVPLDVDELGVDFLSLSAHKFGGPKGVGLLYARRGAPFAPTQAGGAQERDRRAGTENVAGIVGMSVALERAERDRERNAAACAALRDGLLSGIIERVEGVEANGDLDARLPGNVNVSFHGVEAEALLMGLDLAGIAASSGSACTAGSLEPSHVLLAMGRGGDLARNCVRFTLGPENTAEEADYVVETLASLVPKLRALAGSARR